MKLKKEELKKLIQEQYLELLSEGIENEQIIDEGWKEIALSAALALGTSFSGAKAASKDVAKNKVGIEKSDKASDVDTVKIDLSKSFESGKYKTIEDSISEDKLKQLGEFLLKNPTSNFTILVNASESLVPNRDGETEGAPVLKTGQLAANRASTVIELIKTFEKNLREKTNFKGKIDIKSNVLIGKTPYNASKDNKDDDKYKKEQFVNLYAKITGEQKPDMKINANSKQAVYDERNHILGYFYNDVRASDSKTQSGNLDTKYEGVLFVLADKNGKETSEKYLIPSEFINTEGITNVVTNSQLQKIKNQDKDIVKK